MSTMYGWVRLGRATMLAFSLYLVGCGSGGGPKLIPEPTDDGGPKLTPEQTDGGGPKLTPEQTAGGTALCTKAAACSGGTSPSSSDMNQCVDEIAGVLQIFPDPDAFSACINGMSCLVLEGSDPAPIIACADFNRESFTCSDAETLYGCGNSGKCTSISCPDVCALMNFSFDHCGASNDTSKAANICWCR